MPRCVLINKSVQNLFLNGQVEVEERKTQSSNVQPCRVEEQRACYLTECASNYDTSEGGGKQVEEPGRFTVKFPSSVLEALLQNALNLRHRLFPLSFTHTQSRISSIHHRAI